MAAGAAVGSAALTAIRKGSRSITGQYHSYICSATSFLLCTALPRLGVVKADPQTSIQRRFKCHRQFERRGVRTPTRGERRPIAFARAAIAHARLPTCLGENSGAFPF